MPVAVRAISTAAAAAAAAAAGLGFSGAGYLYYKTQTKATSPPSTQDVKPIQQNVHDPRPFQLLTPEEIDNRLTSGQFVTRANQLKRVKGIYTNRLASNDPVEDNYSINLIQHNKLIAGVYDGHIGPYCSQLIRKELPIYVARQLQQQENNSKDNNTEDAISQAFVLLDQDIQQRFYDLFPKNVKRATEQDIRDAVARHPNPAAADMIIKEAITGSCACTVYLDGDDLYAANTGDSRVVVIRQEEDGSWTGRRLVEEQSPAHPEWRAHLISQHPPEEADAIVQRNRIFGLIAVGGSFGDIMYKVPKEYQMKVLPYIPYETYSTFARYHHRIVANYRTPPYLSSKPLVSHHKLQKGDRFIVLGTDGLWDELCWDSVRSTDGDQVAAELMSAWNKSSSKDKNAATHLLRQALLYDAVYKNVREKLPVTDPVLEMSKRLTRQPSRHYRDDITITVIELKDEDETPDTEFENVGPVTEPEVVDASQPRLVIPRKGSTWWMWSRL